jgi:twinkle protein
MLMANRGKEIISAIWEAKTFRPDGIVSGSDLWSTLSTNEIVYSVDYPFVGLNEKTHGLRKSELTTITAGSGIGKSALVREIGYDLIQKGEKVGFIMLEETVKRTALGLMGLHLDKPLHLGLSPVESDELRGAFDSVIGNGRVYFYDSFGSTAIENLLARIKFLSKGEECDWIILDHLSIVVSGLGDGDERRLIDNAMTALRTLVQETGVGLILVSHLKRPDGNRGHEEGAHTSLSQLRGSHAIAQLSDMVIGLERNQQGEDSNVTTIRVLKNRFSGECGVACHAKYNPLTGRMQECNPDFEEVENEF